MVTPVSLAVQTSTAPTVATASGFQGLSGDDFMLILLAQLRNQNPLDPMQDKEWIGQVTQLNSLQELQELNTRMEAMGDSQQFMGAASLIGKTASYFDDDGGVLQAQVTGVSATSEGITVWMGAQCVALERIVHIGEADA